MCLLVLYIVYEYGNTLLCFVSEWRIKKMDALCDVALGRSTWKFLQQSVELIRVRKSLENSHIWLFFTDKIKDARTQVDEEEDFNVLTFEDLLCFSYQVAKGMEFLESKSVWWRVANFSDRKDAKNRSVYKRQVEGQSHSVASLSYTSFPGLTAKTELQF